MEWIKCSDRMPKKTQRVLLCYDKDGFVLLGLWERIGDGRRWRVSGQYRELDLFTHWMPLPEPPTPNP